MNFHSYCLDKRLEDVIETSVYESPKDVTVDEELISIVQQRPALYDHRIPPQERTKLKKNDLWQEVSNCLGGKFII